MKNQKNAIGMFCYVSNNVNKNTVETLFESNGKYFIEFNCGKESNRRIAGKNISKIGSGKINIKSASALMKWSNNSKNLF